MALGINTNVASLNAQNQLSKSQGMNDQALQRLSSGLRINSAKDDAAGLAISTRFQSQISGLNVATRNANDGISLAQTAEGALNEVTNNLQRIRELAVQSANATNNSSDRQALDDEVQQRIAEIDRISSQTAFNGLNVLDGSLNSQNFQVGANSGEVIALDLSTSTRKTDIGGLVTADLDIDNDLSGGGSFTIAVDGGDAQTINFAATDSAADIATAITESGVSGLTSVEGTNEQTLGFSTVSVADGEVYELQIDGEVAYQVTGSGGSTTVDGSTLETEINNAGIEGVSASWDSGSNELTITKADGANFTLQETNNAAAESNGFGLSSTSAQTYVGDVSIESTSEIAIAGSEAAKVGTAQTYSTESGSLDTVNVRDVDAANDAINRVDAALSQVNDFRATLGAIQNRFESTIANLSTSVENLSASNSRILDADFAAETANLAKSQVLQQAGISVLAQANARPQQVLSLLQ